MSKGKDYVIWREVIYTDFIRQKVSGALNGLALFGDFTEDEVGRKEIKKKNVCIYECVEKKWMWKNKTKIIKVALF